MSPQSSRRHATKTLPAWNNSRPRLDELLVLAGMTTAFLFTLAVVFGFIAG